MRKLFNISYFALVSLIALTFSACTEDYEYTAANAPENQVYFSNTLASTIDIDKNAGCFDVAINRVSDKGALTVPLTFDAAENNIYTVPSSVSFADGEKSANIHITYNVNDVVYGAYTGGTIKIGGDDFDTTYGLGSYTFNAGATEWVDIETNESMGSYREDLVTTFFEVKNAVYDVKIQKSIVNEGMYRMVNPYGEAYPHNDPGDYDTSKDYYWVINATDPNYVYFETFHSGMAWSYGEFTFTSLVAFYLEGGNSLETIKSKRPDLFGKLVNGVIEMPKGSMGIGMADYNNGGIYGANNNGMLAVALPGAIIADYMLLGQYMGRFTDTKDNDFASVQLTFGADIAKVKYALISKNGDANATIQGIIDGSVESTEITESGNIQIPYTESGSYYLILVIYNNAGEAVDAGALELKLTSSRDNVEQFTDIAAGVLTIGARDFSGIFSSGPWGLLFDETFQMNSILSQSTSNPAHFRISPFLDDKGEYPLDFTVTEEGKIVVDNIETGITSQKGMIYATDLATNMPDLAAQLEDMGIVSSYNKNNGTYGFSLIYTDAEDGAYACELETFEITTVAGANAMKAAINKAKASYQNGGIQKVVPMHKRHFMRRLINENQLVKVNAHL